MYLYSIGIISLHILPIYRKIRTFLCQNSRKERRVNRMDVTYSNSMVAGARGIPVCKFFYILIRFSSGIFCYFQNFHYFCIKYEESIFLMRKRIGSSAFGESCIPFCSPFLVFNNLGASFVYGDSVGKGFLYTNFLFNFKFYMK